jgi:hypothetical protein
MVYKKRVKGLSATSVMGVDMRAGDHLPTYRRHTPDF